MVSTDAGTAGTTDLVSTAITAIDMKFLILGIQHTCALERHSSQGGLLDGLNPPPRRRRLGLVGVGALPNPCAPGRRGVDAVNTSRLSASLFAYSRVVSRPEIRRFRSSTRFL